MPASAAPSVRAFALTDAGEEEWDDDILHIGTVEMHRNGGAETVQRPSETGDAGLAVVVSAAEAPRGKKPHAALAAVPTA